MKMNFRNGSSEIWLNNSTQVYKKSKSCFITTIRMVIGRDNSNRLRLMTGIILVLIHQVRLARSRPVICMIEVNRSPTISMTLYRLIRLKWLPMAKMLWQLLFSWLKGNTFWLINWTNCKQHQQLLVEWQHKYLVEMSNKVNIWGSFS